MFRIASGAVGLFVALTTPAAADTAHGTGAHGHATGTVSVTIRDSSLDLTVKTPAYNVLGFDHSAQSVEDKRLVSAVRSLLEKPRALFDLPADAGCSLQTADVEIGPEENIARKTEESADDRHALIAARYSYDCAKISAMDRIGFLWFEAFPIARRLNVMMQSREEQLLGRVTPKAPDFRL